MDEALPTDVVEQLRRDFGNRAEAVSALLLARRRLGSSDYIGDRLVRCIVFTAHGDETRVPLLIELERQDFRDLIMAAEYDAIGMRRLWDFNRPFRSAHIAELGEAPDLPYRLIPGSASMGRGG